ncbi:hypothetical protein [Chamaesiphon sp.]|uniref:hypothetical protein n=1 Tax=Chamaesiphon sp. TaxID=2814140 RepID=UPI0035943C04
MQTVSTSTDRYLRQDVEFLSLPPLYCYQRQAKPCIRADRGGNLPIDSAKPTLCLSCRAFYGGTPAERAPLRQTKRQRERSNDKFTS